MFINTCATRFGAVKMTVRGLSPELVNQVVPEHNGKGITHQPARKIPDRYAFRTTATNVPAMAAALYNEGASIVRRGKTSHGQTVWETIKSS